MSEDEKKFFVTMSERMESARPYDKAKFDIENKRKDIKKTKNRLKTKAAKMSKKKILK
jgi:hypothetical protein